MINEKNNYEMIVPSLNQDGCYSTLNFLNSKKCEIIKNESLSLLNSLDLSLTKEYKNFMVGNNSKSRELQGALGSYSKPVIITRGCSDYDMGLVDIFNAHKLISSIPYKELNEFVQKLFINVGYKGAKSECSIYWNDGVKKIRGYHRDAPGIWQSSKRLFKLFIYLTDVPNISYGPYSYIPKTHDAPGSSLFANQIIGNYTDPNEYDLDLNPKIFLGKAGTMIISNQAGFHRGLPQEENKKRMILVCKIRPF